MSMPEPTDIAVDDPAMAAIMPIIEHPECTCHFVDIGVGHQKVDENPDCPRCTAYGLAGAVLTALAKAALLLPPGAKSHEEVGTHFLWTYGGEVVDRGVERCVDSSCRSPHDRRRTVWTGPWTEVQP